MLNAILKRTFDVAFSLIGLFVLLPLFAVISVLILFHDGFPVFFRQVRVGRYGRHFRIWKFRSMYRDSESKGLQITVGDDPRITPVGRWIRKTKVDELPQLINVLVGEMSFVGPRPEVPKYVDLYTKEQCKILQFRPGITDPASLKLKNESEFLEAQINPEEYYVKELLPLKIQISQEYMTSANVFSDLKLIFFTVIGLGYK